MPFDPDVNQIRISIYHKKLGKKNLHRWMVNCDEKWTAPIDCDGSIDSK